MDRPLTSFSTPSRDPQMPPKKLPAPSFTATNKAARGPMKSKSQYPSEQPGRTRRGESPALEDGRARTMRPYDKEWSNIRNQTDRPDGRSPTRGRGYYATGE